MSVARTIMRGSGSNLTRIAFTSIAALALPPLLTRSLAADEYSAWVTLLQLSTYIGLLDIGLQTVVARFVAQHHAKHEHEHAVRAVVSAVRILAVAAAVGCGAVIAAAAAIPVLLPDLPQELVGPTRVSLLLVGFSSALMLPFGPYLSASLGLQRYGYPTVVAIASRLVSAAAIVISAALGGGIVAMGAALATVNVATVVAQRVGWRRSLLPLLGVRAVRPDRATITILLSTGGLIALWSLGGILVNGIDIVVVSHFDFASAGAFAVAATVVGFLLSLLGGLFSPLMPAAAALHGDGAADAIRVLTLKATRYSSLIVVLSGGGLIVFAYPLLAIWVGADYAAAGAPLLRLLVVGHCIRQLGYAYSLVVVARGQQKPATVATMAEAAVNLVASVVLAQVMGAAGVAIGTVLGAIVSIGLHLIVTMRYAGAEIPVTRRELGVRGVALPLATGLPLLLLLPTFDGEQLLPADPLVLVLSWVCVLVAVFAVGLDGADRGRAATLLAGLRRTLSRRTHAY